MQKFQLLISKLHICLLFLMFFCVTLNAQNLKEVDTLTNNVISKVYIEEIDNKNSDSIKRESSFNAYPYVFYTPESEFAVGAGGIYVFYTDEGKKIKPSKIGFGGYYSTNKQYKISMNSSFYFNDNKLVIQLPVSYGYFVNKYWGIGDETEDYENAPYTITTFAGTIKLQIPPLLFSSDRSGLIIDVDHTTIEDKLNNELLLDEDLIGNDGGTAVGFGGDLVWDSRDHLFYPNKGGYQYFSVIFYTGLGDFTYSKFKLDVRHYFKLGQKRDRVLAANVYVESTVGDTPFYALPSMGGKQMRGFFYGRYRDNFYLMSQVEYRQYFSKRWGFVVFGALGNVSEDIVKYDFQTLKYSVGSGIRFLFNKKEKINLRADIGVGKGGNAGIYFGIEEVF